VFAVLGVAQLLLKSGRISASVTRKVVHIGVSHYWLIAMVLIDSWWAAAIPPLAFIFINTASYFARLFPAMEHEERRKNLGTIYFPIALLISVLLTWLGPVPIWMGGLGIVVLGWGDGLASLVGERTTGRTYRIFGNTKSVGGSVTMLVAALVVTVAFFAVFVPNPFSPSHLLVIAGTAVLAAVVEALTPFGMDNLSVPLATMGFVFLLV
jgi:phytol kinase